ncbi:MAG: phosphohydrolase, partial [Sediminibacterium sp.]
TRIPQSPTTKLQEIIADADLDYLGRSDYTHIASKLFAELKVQDILHEEAEWVKLQVSFIKSHHYFTNFSKVNRDPVKQKHLQQLIGL